MAEKYYSILTNRGKELEAQSSATGKPVIIKDFVVGDGNGQPVKPDPAQTKLVREVYRNAISALQVSPDQANQFIAQLVLATGVGGFVVREVGLLTDAGELYSVANCAAIEKPENGVSVNLQYRLAVSETASIELKVATGDGLFLRQDANLSDVKDVVQSRKSLGLKGAAVLDVGKVANTVAAGDDTRIVNALQKNNNLSELADKAKARSNLELKTAAQKDIVTSTSDTTADRVPVVGWQGLGLAAQFRMGQVSQFIAYASTDLKEVPANGAGWQSAYGASRRAQIFMTTGGYVYSRFSLSDVTYDVDTPWAIHYTTLNKPTAADVGALPVSSGSLTVDLNTLGRGDSRGIYYQATNAGATAANHYPVQLAGTLYVTPSAYGSQQMYVTYTNRIFIRAVTGSFNGTGPWSDWVEMYGPNNKPNSDVVNCISRDGSHVGGFANGDVTRPYLRHTASNAVVVLAKAGDSYTKAESDNGYMPKTGAYTKAESDGRFQPKGNYTPAGQAYTKAESDARYQLKNTASRAANGWFKDTTTGMIYQWGRNASSVVGNTTVTFPIAFPNACLNVQNTLIRNSGSAGERPWGFVTSFNNTSVNLSSDATGSYWYAIGY
ncbi:phage tail-collar fiber domain-containing protein [Enterobacter cloacae]|uniref:phage tail-collar fiber domain-containing protein n=3 Tax=Enterobacter cloacae TaxID=550 RepID=UPI001D06D7B9|nr:phage tail protein [Enterobacter cloacae]